jgi:hypothetical protein
VSRRKKYRKELHRYTRMPDDGDHYCLAVHPPLNSDDVYCRVYCEGRNWGGSARAMEGRDEAIDYMQSKLDELEEKATDDKRRGSISYYPEPPKPANTRYVVHPDFDGEIGPREVWGDATLESFGVSPDSTYEDQAWYETRQEYQEWLEPLRDMSGRAVLRLYAQDLTQMAYWWYMADRDDEDTLYRVRYRPKAEKLDFATVSWTSATRTVGGIGITHAPPADIRTRARSQTPFIYGTDENDVQNWFDEEDMEPMDKADANQVDDDGEMPRRHAGGASA